VEDSESVSASETGETEAETETESVTASETGTEKTIAQRGQLFERAKGGAEPEASSQTTGCRIARPVRLAGWEGREKKLPRSAVTKSASTLSSAALPW
jgi:hypothetical protein